MKKKTHWIWQGLVLDSICLIYPGGRGPLVMAGALGGVGLALGAWFDPEPEFDPWLSVSPFMHTRGDISGLGALLPWVGVEPVEDAKKQR